MQNDTFDPNDLSAQAGSVVNTAKEVASQAADFIRRKLDRGSREFGGRLSAAAEELEAVGDDMLDRGEEISATVARQIARLARRAGHYLENTDTMHMLEDARRFAREQPWTVVAIGVVTGFALSRVVKHALSGGPGDYG